MLFIYLIIHMKKLHVEATLKSSTIIGRYFLHNHVKLAEFLCHVPQKSVSQRFVVELAKNTYIMSYLQDYSPTTVILNPGAWSMSRNLGGWVVDDVPVILPVVIAILFKPFCEWAGQEHRMSVSSGREGEGHMIK